MTTPDYARYETLLVQKEPDGVALLTLNRPERRNAVSLQMHDEFEEVFGDLGGDVEAMKTGEFRPKPPLIPYRKVRRLTSNLLEIEQPVIAAVNGDSRWRAALHRRRLARRRASARRREESTESGGGSRCETTPRRTGMEDALTILEEADGAALLTLNRPDKRNALSRTLRQEIVEQLGALEKRNSVRAVVLTGAPPAFCAGFDRSEFAGSGMAEVFAEATEYHRQVYTFAKPLIAAVNGPALGGGCDLAAMCDFRLASSRAVFGQPQVRFGATAAYDLMRAVLDPGAAREMCLTGRGYDAQEALAMGLVNRVVAPDELLDAARTVAREIAALPEGMAEAAKRGFVAQQPRLFGS